MLRRHFLGLSLIGVLATAATPTLAQDDLEKVRLTHSTEGFAFLPLLVAVAMDYFKAAGVDAEVIRTGSGSKSMAAAVAGDADVVFGSPVTVLKAREQGSELVLFSASITQVAADIVVSKEWADSHGITADSTIEEKFAALDGIRIGVTGAGSGSDQIARYLGKQAGLDPDRKMSIIGLGSDAGTILAALQLDRVDAISISAPTGQIAMSQFDAVMLFNNALGEVESIDGYFWIGAAANEPWLEANPDAAAKTAKALQMALDALRDPEENLRVRDVMHERYFDTIDKSVFDGLWPDQIRLAPRSGEITQEMMTQLIDLSEPFTGEPLDPSLIEGSYDNQFAQAALGS